MNDPQFDSKKVIFHGDGKTHRDALARRGDPPPWRNFGAHAKAAQPAVITQDPAEWRPMIEQRGKKYYARREEKLAVNLALYLRRPLLVSGSPGTGKSSLAYAVAYELGLGPVLVWPITSRSTLQQGLYNYDAIGRLQAGSPDGKDPAASGKPAVDIGKFIRLGPLGTALRISTEESPAILLIDEIDKSDIDLPNDLLHVFEEGYFEIPELSRLADESPDITVSLHRNLGSASVVNGRVACPGFPIVVMTSNGERDFPPAFHRRCVRLDIKEPDADELAKIVRHRIAEVEQADGEAAKKLKELIDLFKADRDDTTRELATDQLLNAVFLQLRDVGPVKLDELREIVLRPLTNARAVSPEAPKSTSRPA